MTSNLCRQAAFLQRRLRHQTRKRQQSQRPRRNRSGSPNRSMLSPLRAPRPWRLSLRASNLKHPPRCWTFRWCSQCSRGLYPFPRRWLPPRARRLRLAAQLCLPRRQRPSRSHPPPFRPWCHLPLRRPVFGRCRQRPGRPCRHPHLWWGRWSLVAQRPAGWPRR